VTIAAQLETVIARSAEAVIAAPGLNMSLDQPIRDMVTRLAASAVHFSTLPSAFLTSKESSVCGFMNRKPVTVPFKVVTFCES